jgi:O-antigen/teichoic acid export membrane protein
MQETKTLVAYCLPLTISSIFGVIAPRADILLLGYWTSTQEVGVYLAAFQTAAILSLVLGAFVTGTAPILSRAWSQQGLSRLQDSYQTVSRLSVSVSLPMFCGLILFAREILCVFGQEFSAGVPALILLALGQIFNNATGSANTVLLMSGHSRLVMTNTIIMGIVLLVATAISIPLWGIIGAALAASVTFVVTNLVRVSQVWRLLHVQPYTWDLIKPIVASAGASLIVSAVRASGVMVPVPALWVLLIILYLFGLLLLKVNQQDRLAMQSLFSRITLGVGRT